MKLVEPKQKPSKCDQKVAIKSYNALLSVMQQIDAEQLEIEIQETKERITIPSSAFKLLGEILKGMGEGKSMSIVPVSAEMTTQAAAEYMGCSRPYFVKLLEEGEIAYTKIGKHRRVKFDDISKYKKQLKVQQKKNIIDIMNSDEENGLYDS